MLELYVAPQLEEFQLWKKISESTNLKIIGKWT